MSGGPEGTGGDAQRPLRRSGAPPWVAGAAGLFSPWRRPRAQNGEGTSRSKPRARPTAQRDGGARFVLVVGVLFLPGQGPATPATPETSSVGELRACVACCVRAIRVAGSPLPHQRYTNETCKQNIKSKRKEGVQVKSKKREPAREWGGDEGRLLVWDSLSVWLGRLVGAWSLPSSPA